MAINRTSGNGHDMWTPEDHINYLAGEIVRNASLSHRILGVVERLSERLDQYEQQANYNLPTPQDFGIELPEPQRFQPVVIPGIEQQNADELADDGQQDDEFDALPNEHREPVRTAKPGELLARFKATDLTSALTRLVRFIPPKWHNKLLECVKLERVNNKLRLTAGDGDHSLSIELEGLCHGELSMCVPARLFLQASQGFSDGEVDMTLDGLRLTLTSGATTCDVEAIDADDYPEDESLEGEFIQLPDLPLLRALKLGLHCAVKESSTGAVHYTNGVFLHLEQGKAVVVGTDGHRLVETEFPQAGKVWQPWDLLLPARTAAELVKLIPQDNDRLLDIEANSEQVEITLPAWTEGVRKVVRHPRTVLRCKLLDVKFPPYQMLLNSQPESRAWFDRKELTSLLERVVKVTDKDKPRVHFLVRGGSATITAEGPGGAKLSTSTTVDQQGVDFGIELDPTYVLAFVRLLTGRAVELDWLGDQQPAYLADPEEKGLRYVLSPIRKD